MHAEKKHLINCRGNLIDLSIPRVMGILNVTGNSFYDGGKYLGEQEILSHTEKMLFDGADIIDIGAVSTKPGSVPPTQSEEAKQLESVIKLLRKHFPSAILSADTYRAATAKVAVESGADIINDIGGGTLDEHMFKTIAALHVPYILMHIKGTPLTMQDNPHYDDVFKEVLNFFIFKCKQLKEKGVKDIIIDPGFGFGKNLEHNFTLLKRMKDFQILNYPILAGISRKSIVNKVLGIKANEALNGTTVLNTLAVINGAGILRVHDVKEAVETIKLIKEYQAS